MQLTAIVMSGLLASGCSGFIHRQAGASTYEILEKSREAAGRESDLQLARDAIPGGLLQVEAFALAYPEQHGFRDLYADMLCQYAVAFVFDDWEDAKLGGRDAEADRVADRLRPLLVRCTDLNLERLPAAWRAARTKSDDALLAMLPSANRDQVPPLLWIATTDAVGIALDPLRNFSRLPGVETMLTRCAQLSPGFHGGDAEVLLATLEAGRGAVFGNADGQAAFDRARAVAGDGALMVDVMYARGTAVARKDRKLFTAVLERVLAADVTRWSGRRLSNELARHKARRYLAAAATLIP
jgi:hypothetical protein